MTKIKQSDFAVDTASIREDNPRPSTVKPPNQLLEQALSQKVKKHKDPLGIDPTRYGDWEKKGRCIDF